MLNNKTILITGGTGSFGNICTRTILARYQPKRVIIFSRDEFKQFNMANEFPQHQFPQIEFIVGDIRDRDCLNRAMIGVDIVIHTAALKQVPTAELNPMEAVKTNILGTSNLIETAIQQNVEKVIALSTDKAVNPVNLYGATKLCSDKLIIAANNYSRLSRTRFAVVRYGNVIASRGSVIPFFRERIASGRLPVTDPRMTRYWVTLQQGVDIMLTGLANMAGGEVFILKQPSMRIMDLARAVCPDCEIDIVGIRPGEKIHEVLIPREEARNTVEFDTYFVIRPAFEIFNTDQKKTGETPVAEDFEYASDTNSWWMDTEELRDVIQNIPHIV
jgi:UDP-N-acetylglucosamine 4,6-dehydratase